MAGHFVDDLQRIIPETLQRVGNRKMYLALSIVIVVLVVAVIALAAVLGHMKVYNGGGGPSKGSCLTHSCIHAAEWILNNINPDIDPCTDFYKFACGGWTSRNNIPPDASEQTMIELTELETDEKLREIIEKGTPGQHSDAEMKLRYFYLSCIHEYGREKEAGMVLLDVIRDAIKGWYVLDPEGWSSQWSMSDAIARVRSDYQVFLLFKIYYGSSSSILDVSC